MKKLVVWSLWAGVLFIVLPTTSAYAEEVTLKAEDGVAISGDWRPAKKAMGALVFLHMHRSDRTAWKSMMTYANRRGFATLAIDFRGYGKSRNISGIDYGQAVANGDPKLYNSLYKDVTAGVAYLAKKGFNNDNIILVGANIGASAALDYGSRNTSIRGAILLTPRTRYMGMNALKHLGKWGGRRLLFVSSEEDMKRGPRALYGRLPDKKRARLLSFPEKGINGTRMFGRVKGLEKTLVDWAKKSIMR